MLIDIHTHHTTKDSHVFSVLSLYSDFDRAENGRPCSLGVHPCYLDGHMPLLAEQERLAVLRNVLAIGECGLDRVCNKDIELQAAIFAKQVKLADTLHKPLVIHCVRAFDELLAVIEELNPGVPVIIHGYNKKADVAARLLASNMYLSFGAAIMNGKSPAVEVLKAIPADQFFLETDDSGMPIEEIYRRAAEIRETGLDSLTLQLEQNFRNVFKYEL